MCILGTCLSNWIDLTSNKTDSFTKFTLSHTILRRKSEFPLCKEKITVNSLNAQVWYMFMIVWVVTLWEIPRKSAPFKLHSLNVDFVLVKSIHFNIYISHNKATNHWIHFNGWFAYLMHYCFSFIFGEFWRRIIYQFKCRVNVAQVYQLWAHVRFSFTKLVHKAWISLTL